MYRRDRPRFWAWAREHVRRRWHADGSSQSELQSTKVEELTRATTTRNDSAIAWALARATRKL